MKISRRDFLKWSIAAAAALKMNLDTDRMNTVLAAETDPPVIWLQGAGCSGCTVSTLNVTNPTTIDNVLLNKISMKYNSTIMTSAGETAIQALENAANQYKGQFILVIEGAIPSGTKNTYCIIGELNGTEITMEGALLKYGPMAKYVVAAGTCASFGGVPAASPNNTGCKSVKALLSGKTTNPIVNLPACPVHPTVLIQTLLDLILTGIPTLDSNSRPTKYYSQYIHSTCPRRDANDASAPGKYGCYEHLGCMGVYCNAHCVNTKWNNGVNWCIQSNYPCIGCAKPGFPTNPLNIPQ
ncbi:MAG: hydrogenase small subunit [Clostridia bacterium]|nr:hydrogenase small subunit [Clostridia bacterium]